MDFETVREQELEEIMRRRKRRSTVDDTVVARADDPDSVLAAIRARVAADARREPVDGEPPDDLAGIAISGGGIRSATFALGVLQALSRRRLFERADYLSTVSGGGYIGSCLSSMFAHGVRRFPFRRAKGQPERPLIRHLRRYSNYLLPRGLIDLLGMPGVALRGILATFVSILPYLMAAVIILVLVYGQKVSDALVNGTAAVVDVARTTVEGEPSHTFTIRRGMQRHAIAGSGASPRSSLESCRGESTEAFWTPVTGRVVDSFAAVVGQIPCTHGDFLIYDVPEGTLLQTECFEDGPGLSGCSLCRADPVERSTERGDTIKICPAPAPYVARQLDDGGWYITSAARDLLRPVFPAGSSDRFTVRIKQRSYTLASQIDRATWQPRSIWDGSFLVTGSLLVLTVVALLLFPLASWIGHRLPAARLAFSRRSAARIYPGLLVLLVLAVVIELQPIAAYYFTASWSWLSASAATANVDYLVYALIGLGVLAASWVLRPNQAPEQSSSGRGKLFLIGLIGPLGIWLLALLIAHWTLCRPPNLLFDRIVEPLGVYSLPSAVHGALDSWVPFGKSIIALFNLQDIPHDIIEFRVSRSMCFGPLEVAPLQDPLSKEDRAAAFALADRYRDVGLPLGAYAALYVYLFIGILAFVYTQLFLNVNHTSLHRYYRDRLSKAYIVRPRPGATDGSIDANDEQTLDGLGDDGCVGPYHLVNGTLNMSSGAGSSVAPGNLRTETESERKRRSVDHFLFSMLHVGSDSTGYCSSRQMHDVDPHVNLGTAMAISGAAASPRMGEFTVSTLAVLMVLLNVRLGYWIPHPGMVDRGEGLWTRRPWLLRFWRRYHPGPRYVRHEMSGAMSLDKPFVNVSDGGHIENLGVFALVRRRCRIIVAIDGERDSAKGDHGFAGLATAIRMARIELGVEIEIDVEGVGAPGNPHFAVGRIVYGQDEPDGWLVYLKLSYSGDENPYVRAYRKNDPEFPHQSTGDQFFDEPQFEAYRALGEHVAKEFIDARAADLGDAPHLAPLLDARSEQTGLA